MRARCYKCNYGWNYKGKQRGKDNISCPRCSYRLRADKVLLEELDVQQRLHNFPLEIHKKPKEIHTYIHKKRPLIIEFETIKDKDGFVYRVDKRMSEQFKEALCNEKIEQVEEVQEQEQEEPVIRILPPKFKIIRVIPYNPIKHLEHMKNYPL